MSEGYVLVIGSAGIDVKGLPDGPLLPGSPNHGFIRNDVGGVARNVAETLARLEVEVVLVTAVGDDMEGRRVIDMTRRAGVDCDHSLIVEDARTGTYLALLKTNGELDVAISDFDVMDAISPEYLRENLDLFRGASLIFIDMTLSPESLAVVFDLASRYSVRVCADPTTPGLAGRLCPYISQLYLVTPNASETTALCGLKDPARDRDSATSAARHLVSLGAQIAVVTLAEQGLAYADGSGGGFIKAIKTRVIDSTGAGDALTGAVIFGLMNEVELDEAMRLGVTAASLTLRTRETVRADLNQELLYDELVI